MTLCHRWWTRMQTHSISHGMSSHCDGKLTWINPNVAVWCVWRLRKLRRCLCLKRLTCVKPWPCVEKRRNCTAEEARINTVRLYFAECECKFPFCDHLKGNRRDCLSQEHYVKHYLCSRCTVFSTIFRTKSMSCPVQPLSSFPRAGGGKVPCSMKPQQCYKLSNGIYRLELSVDISAIIIPHISVFVMLDLSCCCPLPKKMLNAPILFCTLWFYIQQRDGFHWLTCTAAPL